MDDVVLGLYGACVLLAGTVVLDLRVACSLFGEMSVLPAAVSVLFFAADMITDMIVGTCILLGAVYFLDAFFLR